MAEELQEEEGEELSVKAQLAFGALACLILSMALGMLPDSLFPGPVRTGTWLVFAAMALGCFYLAFPHMWRFGLWLGAIYGLSAIGLLMLLGRGEKLNIGYPFAVGIGALMELGALILVYGVLMRVRLARATLMARVPLGLWLLSVLLFFLISNGAAAGWAYWAVTNSGAGLALYATGEFILSALAIYICWAPEALWTSGGAAAEAIEVKPEETVPGAALLKRMVRPRKEEHPGKCPACGGALKPVHMRCPACGETTSLGWCAVSEVFAAPCPSCGSAMTVGDAKCKKCGAALAGLACPSCRKASPFRNWEKV